MLRYQNRLRWGLALLAGIACEVGALPAHAGGGPQNVMLVVNSRSAGSKQVANHYVRLRNVPATNVVYLDYSGPRELAPAKVFRDQILQPVLETIDRRKLSAQIDMIAYSTDFPWRLDFRTELDVKNNPLPRTSGATASLTGATYLYAFVLAKSRGLVGMHTNGYLAPVPGKNANQNLGACRDIDRVATRGFRGRYRWALNGTRVGKPEEGVRYMMSTMLGVTTGRGNTVKEVIRCLDRSAEADVSPPVGSFIFMQRDGAPRSKPRHTCFASVVNELRELGSPAMVQRGVMPKTPIRVAGLMCGAASLPFKPGLVIEPGAICEHLTSYGGDLRRGITQTPLSELIRAGASGASGTVAEPLAVASKFPLPSMHVHYRRGCSLAESFYQSIAAPYQLLIVGDPLCQPWAKRPGLRVAGWPAAADGSIQPGTMSTFGFEELGIPVAEPAATPPSDGGLTITPTVTATDGATGVAYWELFVDGRLWVRLPSEKTASLPAERLGPGWHGLACVGMNPDRIESQRIQAGSIEVLQTATGPIEPVRMEVDRSPTPSDPRVAVSATAPGADRIVIRQNARAVATIHGDSGGAFIPADLLGRGPVRLQAVAEPSGAASPPMWTRVE